jgi:hypothetical protein
VTREDHDAFHVSGRMSHESIRMNLAQAALITTAAFIESVNDCKAKARNAGYNNETDPLFQTSKMMGMIIGFLSIVFLRYFFSTDRIFA